MRTTTPTFPDFAYVNGGAVKATHPEPGLVRRVGATNDKLTVVEHRMEKGWAGARHSHPHDQVVYVVSGHLSVTCGDTTFEVRGASLTKLPVVPPLSQAANFGGITFLPSASPATRGRRS
jgi:quercetin dioxygenase-like cupin family protein